MATGVLVLGIGTGTKQLDKYLLVLSSITMA
jgi:tRNA U55 pseudouridine synthase TruB